MLAIAISVNILLLAGIILLAFIAGYLLRTVQLRKSREKVYELEQEMLDNHARILDLERENALMKKKLESQGKNSIKDQV